MTNHAVNSTNHQQESRTFIRGAYYLATQLLLRAYHQGIHVNSEEVLQLRKVAADAAKNKQSIVFLPSHRSHIDYISLQLVCYRLGLALPTVVAGDNLNFPLVGPFLQHAGAMWIRRSFGNDKLYSTVVQAYMDTLLQQGFNFECFIEGGRSRTGKLLQPKFGILSFILESVMSGSVQDCIICPVSTQYDKVVEVDSYITELLGMPKQKEDLMQFLSASNVLSQKLGRVDVRFHEPWSLRQFITEQSSRFQQQPEAHDEKAFRRRVLTTLGYRVLSEINDVSVVMPTALVGTVLLTLRGRGVGKTELVRRVNWLAERVQGQGGRLAHFGLQDTEIVVQRALDVLGPKLVGTVDNLPEETYFAVDRFQLSFYRNMTIHLFISQALVCAALYTRVKAGGAAETQRMPWQELYDNVQFLSQLFRAEFIFPTASLRENIQTTLKGLEEDHVVQVTRSSSNSDEIDYIELHPAERANGRENFDFYNFLIWPFIEANWLGTVAMFMLTPPPPSTITALTAGTSTTVPAQDGEAWVDQKKFEDAAQLLGKTLYHQGDLSYFEAVNKEALKNAFSRAEEEGIIFVYRNKETKTPPRVRLGEDWIPPRNAEGKVLPEGRLWDFAERTSHFRREGKNRRDGATVKTRVLSLVDLMAVSLFEDAAAALKEDLKASPAKSRRRKMQGKKAKAKL